eukprot:3701671-Prymnesium_polylepis.3
MVARANVTGVSSRAAPSKLKSESSTFVARATLWRIIDSIGHRPLCALQRQRAVRSENVGRAAAEGGSRCD